MFSLAQATDLGLTTSAVRKRASAGRLHRVHRCVYSIVPPALLSRNGRFRAAVLACGPGAVLSHRSAAALHELRKTERARVDVTVPGRAGHAHAGIEVHRSRTLTAADVTIVDGIPCTTIARALLDLAAVLPVGRWSGCWTRLRSWRCSTPLHLQGQLERNSRMPAARKLGAVLAEHRAGATATWSELEERFLTLAGWRVVRVTWRQITNEPAITTRLIADLLGTAA